MGAERGADDRLIDEQLQVQVNHALAAGGLYAALFGWIACAGLVAALAVTRNPFFIAPAAFALTAGCLAASMRVLARRDRLRGPNGVGVMLAFVSLPTAFFLAGYMYESGTATFLTGAISYLYAFLIVITGFMFNPRLSATAGVVAAAQYLAMFALGHEQFEALQASSDVFHTDLSSPIVWINKGLMIMGVGFATAGIAMIARRLLVQTLREARLFGQYVSPEIRDKIVRGAVGERVEAVILFSDLRGFSTYSEGRQPEEIVGQLNQYFDSMVACIRADGGLVDKFIGDAIMAVFEPSTGAAEPVGAAVHCARSMRRELLALNERWARDDIVPFDNGIGVHVGNVVQGPLGSADRKEWTVIGDAVNSAARIESLTRSHDCSIIITDAVFDRLPPETREGFENLGATTVKGKKQPLVIYGAR